MKRQVMPATPEPEGPPVQVHDVEESAEKGWREFERCNESRILHLFYGQQSSTVTCNTCGFFSVTFEPFSTLSLVLPTNSDKCSLKVRTIISEKKWRPCWIFSKGVLIRSFLA